jgi:hypothetical protein
VGENFHDDCGAPLPPSLTAHRRMTFRLPTVNVDGLKFFSFQVLKPNH